MFIVNNAGIVVGSPDQYTIEQRSDARIKAARANDCPSCGAVDSFCHSVNCKAL